MKTKIIIFLAISAVVTLSFTFSTVNNTSKKSKEAVTEKQVSNEPVGGFVSEDKF